MGTKENLQAAFAGESQANRKYLAFAKQAEAEGFKQIARLFRAAAEAETVHAHAHLAVLGGVKSTVENIKAAIEGEGHEFQKMYPAFLAKAQRDKNDDAAISFQNAMAVEKIHHGLYQAALKAAKSGKDLPKKALYVCSICGNTVEGKPPAICPICGAPKTKFSEVK